MKLITHLSHLNTSIQNNHLNFITERFHFLTEETAQPPIIILVEPHDDICGANFSFIGSNGLLSDYFDENEVHHSDYSRPFEWVSCHTDLRLYEALFLVGGEDGYWIMIPDDVVDMHPELHWVLTSTDVGGLSEPLPF